MQILRFLISNEEMAAIEAISRLELRPIPDQIRYILRTELKRRGLLTDELVQEAKTDLINQAAKAKSSEEGGGHDHHDV